jgi:hypothetical protein
MAAQHKQLRQYVDGVPEEELGPMYSGAPQLTFMAHTFGGVAGLTLSEPGRRAELVC